MTIPDPRASYSFASAAGSPSLPDVSQAGFLVGCTESGSADTPRPYGNPATVRSTFGESIATRIAEAHFTEDPNRRPLLIAKAATTTAGILHLDVSGVNGSSVATADGTVKPFLELDGVRILVIQGGDIGVPGIVLRLTIDNYESYVDVNLGTATSVTFPLGGIKVNFAAGDLDTNDEITGWTEPPRWTTAQLEAAFTAIEDTEYRFALVCIAEHLVPSDGTVVSGILDDLEENGIFAHVVATKRRRYHDTDLITIEATFANANPDTLARASGSFITDGFKPGMRVTIDNAVNGANEGTFVRIATVGASTLTFTANVAFTAEAATAGVTIIGSETEEDYAFNSVSEWSAFEDERVSLTKYQIRAAQPIDNSQLDEQLHGALFSRLVSEPIEAEPGQRRRNRNIGGRVAPKRSGRIYQDSVRILPDMRLDGSGVVAPSRDIAVESAPDKRTGAFFVQCRTQGGVTDQIETVVMGRLVNEWKSIVLTLEVDETLSAFPSEPGNPFRLSELAAQRIEGLGLASLRARFKGKISNLDEIDPAEALFYVDRNSDLSTGGVSVTGFIRTLFYARSFTNTIKIRRPGQVG